jgi:hypothetical protein
MPENRARRNRDLTGTVRSNHDTILSMSERFAKAQPEAAPVSPSASRAKWGWLACVAGILVLGAALRIVAARDDFWQDEVWSYFVARQAAS